MRVSNLDLLDSSLDENGKFISNSQVLKWIRQQNSEVNVKITKIPLQKIDNWTLNETELKHDSGKFFKINGISVKNDISHIKEWSQPIINQNEIGYLGFICKKIDNVLHLLVQAKIEPGNINHVQISPTLQATKSNYEKVHEGKDPLYINFFRNVKNEDILVDQLQSEQGSRFLKKRNRNIIIHVHEELKIHKNFTWLTIGQIKKLIKYDNVVNMDTRSVISTIPYNNISKKSKEIILKKNKNIFLKSTLQSDSQLNSINDIISKVTNFKSIHYNDIDIIKLSSLKDWRIKNDKIHHSKDNFFNVIGVNVMIGNREVKQWCQPMIEPTQKGFCGFVCKKIKNTVHFLVQLKYECGNLDLIELGPTVQQTVDDNLTKNNFYNIIFSSNSKIIFDSFQSEEGGRFFQEQNRNILCLIDENVDLEIPDNYIWMTLNQILFFIKHNNYINIQARSVISAILYNNYED